MKHIKPFTCLVLALTMAACTGGTTPPSSSDNGDITPPAPSKIGDVPTEAQIARSLTTAFRAQSEGDPSVSFQGISALIVRECEPVQQGRAKCWVEVTAGANTSMGPMSIPLSGDMIFDVVDSAWQFNQEESDKLN